MAMPEASAVRSLEKSVHPDCVAWVRDRLQLAEFQPEMWQDTHDETTHNFLIMSNEDTLLAWCLPLTAATCLSLSFVLTLLHSILSPPVHHHRPAAAIEAAPTVNNVFRRCAGCTRGSYNYNPKCQMTHQPSCFITSRTTLHATSR